jgi:hypothetical protein
MKPVFEQFPDELWPVLTPRAKAALEDVRERFNRYRDDVEAFVRRLAAGGGGDLVSEFYFPRVRPLRREVSA